MKYATKFSEHPRKLENPVPNDQLDDCRVCPLKCISEPEKVPLSLKLNSDTRFPSVRQLPNNL